MGIIGWLILCLGGLGAVYGSDCVQATAMCSRLWVETEPHRNLIESAQELNSWCRKQSLFFKCLEDIFLVVYGNYSNFPMNMLVSKMFTEDLCLEGSKSRKRYLENAACINKLDLDYCTMPEYLDIVTPDSSVPPTKCSSAEKTFSCIAASMVIKCGFDAVRVYRYLLKVTNYGKEVCGVASPGILNCKDSPDPDGDKVSEVYYGLVHRFGSMPEQVPGMDGWDYVMDGVQSVSHSDESIFESLNKALDSIEYSEGNFESERLSFIDEANRSTDESRKTPVIIEQFKGLLFYNYSDKEFEFYWRQPGSFPIENVTCEHVLTPHMRGIIFECTVRHRPKEPECYYNTMPTTTERLTPELIRDIDLTIPEDSSLDIGERIYLTEYLRAYQLYRMRWEYWIVARLVQRTDEMQGINKHLVKEYPNDKVCAKELRFYDIINDRNISWWQCPSLFSDELRNEIVTFLYGNRTIDDTLFLSNYNEGDKSYIHLFEPLLHAFDNVVCSRVNECHPRGRGVFKCSLKRRDLKGCDYCCDYYIPKACKIQQKDAERESTIERFKGSEEGSGFSEEAAVRIENEVKASTNFVTGVIGEDGEMALDLSTLQSESDSESASDVNLVLLSQDSEGSGENAFLARSGLLSTMDNETPHDDLNEHDLDLADGNVLILQAIPALADFEAAYEIVL